MALDVPGPGRACKVQKGRLQIVLEQGRSGYTLVTHDGDAGRRYLLGVPDVGQLWLLAAAPPHRLVIELRDTVALAPGGRLRGYAAVPLLHRVVWASEMGVEKSMVEILPRELTTSWLGDEGGYEHRVVSRFYSARAVPGEPTMALVPLVLCNRSRESVVPAEAVVHLQDGHLHVLRGRIIAAPRRISFTENGTEEQVRWTGGQV